MSSPSEVYLLLRVWFDVPVALLHILSPLTPVWVGLNQWDLDWKYDISVDYVELRPITEGEFLEHKARNQRAPEPAQDLNPPAPGETGLQ